MKQSSHATVTRQSGSLVLLAIALSVGCADTDDEHPATYQYEATPVSPKTAATGCAVANTGCPCSTPGEIVDCGKIVVKVDSYETCYEGSRICTETGTWSACAADQAIVQIGQ